MLRALKHVLPDRKVHGSNDNIVDQIAQCLLIMLISWHMVSPRPCTLNPYYMF